MIPEGLPSDFKSFPAGQLPTRETCDLDDPYQRFLWMFVALPYVSGGPLIMPIDYYQFVSKRLHDLGAMLQCPSCGHTNEPTLKYQAPLGTDPNWATAPGKWVPMSTPERDPRSPAAQAVDSMVTQQQAEVFNELLGRLSPEQLRALMDRARRDDS